YFQGASVKQNVARLVLLLFGLMPWIVSFASAQAFRPPAVPLITIDPYFSIWSFNDRLNDADTHHWTGKPHTLLSLVRIDVKAYRLAGSQPANVPALEQTS